MVSWKEAADSHDSVASDALVIPISTARPDAGLPPSATTCRFAASYDQPIHQIAGEQIGVTGLDHGHPTQHLPDDDLDVLVVDRRTLGPVDRLHLVDQVLLHPAHAEHPQHVVRIGRTGGQLLTHLDVIAVLHQQPRHAADRELRTSEPSSGVMTIFCSRSLSSICDPSGGLGDRRLALGLASLEELDDTRQTLGDVVTSHTAGVEGPHRQLGTRLTDGLRRDDADGLADVDQLAAGQRTAVAHRAGTAGSLAGEHAAYLDRVRCRCRRAAGC